MKKLIINLLLQIVTDPIALPDGKYVAVNTIGLCTSIGHVLLKQNPKQKKVSNESQCIPRLVLLTSRYETGIFNMINKVSEYALNFILVSSHESL